MTTTQFAAGRDLDALIAEKVMGHKVSWTRNLPQPYTEYGHLIPHYSTSIVMAWAVVEKIMETHFMYSVNASHESGHWCVFYPHAGAPVEGDYATTAPLAICRAALAALRAAPHGGLSA